MNYFKLDKKILDGDTRQYIRKIIKMQSAIFGLFVIVFILFGIRLVSENSEYLKVVAMLEVEEAMQENVNNIIIHMDAIRERKTKEAIVYIEELADRIENAGIAKISEVVPYLQVSEKNALGLCAEAIYIAENGEVFYIQASDLKFSKIEMPVEEILSQELAVCESVHIEAAEVILLIKQTAIDMLVKDEIYEYVHMEYYEGNQYVWVNEVVDMAGGENYAIRRIHPNMIESEGEYLSTSMTDIKGNYPYLTELEGIKKDGKIIHSYYFKNKTDDKIIEKLSYAQYYEPFNWIVATGETLEEIYVYADSINEYNSKTIMFVMIIFLIPLVLVGWVVINLIRKNAFDFRKKMWKQVELTEEIYTTMSVGLFRLYMAEDKKKIIKINPKTLELFDVDNTEEFLHRYVNQIVDETNEQAMKVFLGECDKLKKQWDSESVECNVIWKDGTVHLLKLRNTLVEFDENAKIIQCLCQDITEERKLQQLNLMKAEEKATLDPMTQIKNKKAIEEAIRENIKLAGENKQSVAVGFVDIDNFKDYNSKYGHLQGDEVIKHVAYILRDNIKGIVGRNGGDEFSFCMLNVSEQNVEEIMQYVYEKLNEGLPLLESGEMISTPCSIGIVLTNREDVEYGYVIEEADKAMYYAKERGKNTYHILKI